MSLEAILADIEQRVNKRMHATNKRAIQTRASELSDYALSHEHAHRADDARAAIGYKAIANKDRARTHEPYARIAQRLEEQTALHNPYDDSSRTAITILKGARAHYKTRFAHIKTHLESGLHYTDALLCREHLRQDAYVRRRSRTHDDFRERTDEMIAELDEYISACRQEMQRPRRTWREHAKNWGFRAAAACWTATMAYAAAPLEWLV